MEVPGFLRSGPAGDTALAVLGSSIGLLTHKAGNMAMLPPSSPEVSREREQATATLAVRTTSSQESTVHAGPVMASSVVWGGQRDRELREAGGVTMLSS